MVSPSHKKRAIQHIAHQGLCSVRRACGLVGLAPSSYYHRPQGPTTHRQRLEDRIIGLSKAHPRFGYRFIHQLLRREGWRVNRKRVQRVRHREGLGVSIRKKARRARRAQIGYPLQARAVNHVWSWDFIMDRTTEGRPLKLLTLLDEYTRQCLLIFPARSLTSVHVVAQVQRVVQRRGAPVYIRSDNGPEFIAQAIQDWCVEDGVKTAYIEPGSPWQNGFIESFHSRLRSECLERELFFSVPEARVVIEDWRCFYNGERPHSSLGYQTPDEFAQTQAKHPAENRVDSHPT